MKEQMRIHYDEEGDFLEISVGKPIECYAEEVQPGIFVRKSEANDEIKSISILGFKQRGKNIQDVDVMLPVEISITASN